MKCICSKSFLVFHYNYKRLKHTQRCYRKIERLQCHIGSITIILWNNFVVSHASDTTWSTTINYNKLLFTITFTRNNQIVLIHIFMSLTIHTHPCNGQIGGNQSNHICTSTYTSTKFLYLSNIKLYKNKINAFLKPCDGSTQFHIIVSRNRNYETSYQTAVHVEVAVVKVVVIVEAVIVVVIVVIVVIVIAAVVTLLLFYC